MQAHHLNFPASAKVMKAIAVGAFMAIVLILGMTPRSASAEQNLPNAPCAWKGVIVACSEGQAYQSATSKTQIDEQCNSWVSGGYSGGIAVDGGASSGNRYFASWNCYGPSGNYLGWFTQWFGYSTQCIAQPPATDRSLVPGTHQECRDGCVYGFTGGSGTPTGGVCGSDHFEPGRANTCAVSAAEVLPLMPVYAAASDSTTACG